MVIGFIQIYLLMFLYGEIFPINDLNLIQESSLSRLVQEIFSLLPTMIHFTFQPHKESFLGALWAPYGVLVHVPWRYPNF